MERFVIHLPTKDRNEQNAIKVELFAGREIYTDRVNAMSLDKSIEARAVVGRSYP